MSDDSEPSSTTTLPDTTGWPFVLDVDGTVCFDGRTIADDITEALLACRRSHPLVFASARAMRDLLPVIPEPLRDVTLIGGNGAQLRTGGGETRTSGFPAEVRRQLDALVDRLGLTYFVDGPWDYSSTGDPARPIFKQVDPSRSARSVVRESLDSYVKVILFTDDPEHAEAVRELPVTVHVHEAEGHVDISPSGIDKGAAVLAAGLPQGKFVAFGNDTNDATLFEMSGLAVCVGDHPVGRLADRIVHRSQVAATLQELS